MTLEELKKQREADKAARAAQLKSATPSAGGQAKVLSSSSVKAPVATLSQNKPAPTPVRLPRFAHPNSNRFVAEPRADKARGEPRARGGECPANRARRRCTGANSCAPAGIRAG